MTICVLADLHGDTSHVEALGPKLSGADLVILAGDITHFGGKNAAQDILTVIRRYNTNILAVHGNCDTLEVADYLSDEGINLHKTVMEMGGITFVGFGGSLPGPAKTPTVYGESDYEAFFSRLKDQIQDPSALVLVCHEPPFNTKADRVIGLMHVGSKALRTFIDETGPLACFCGHIHESICIDRVGRTYVVNPGPFKDGRHVEGAIKPGFCDFYGTFKVE
jgi:Icc-related predicted phosphoesterase